MKVKNIYLRIDDKRKWPCLIFFFDNGKTKTMTIKVTDEEAKRIHGSLLSKMSVGILEGQDFYKQLMSNTISLAELEKRYLEMRKKDHAREFISDDTLNSDYTAMKLFTRHIPPITKVNTISKDTIDFWVEQMQSSKNRRGDDYSPYSINHYLSHISPALSWAVEQGWLDKNPIIGYPKLGDTGEPQIKYLTESDIIKFREYFKEHKPNFLDVFNLALWTGLRASELIELKEASLKTEVLGGHIVSFLRVKGKGKKFRSVPLADKALEIVNRRIELLKDPYEFLEGLFMLATDTRIDNNLKRAEKGYLFFEYSHRDSLGQVFRRAREALELQGFNVHSLRHTFATRYIENGGEIKVLKDILGHSDWRMVEHYAKTTEKKISENINAYVK